jgi:hypothetical protein
MGFPVSTGLNVPPWLVDAAELDVLLTRLKRALQRPPSFSSALNPSLLAYDRAGIRDSIVAVAEAAQDKHVELSQALAGFKTHAIDRAHQARLTSLVNELTTLWSVRATMTLGLRRSAVLRRLLNDPAPDLLGILQREDDENSHSAVLRWLLDPRKAPALAPVALRSFVARFPEAERWRAALRDGCVSVRREVVIGHDMKQADNKDRIDLVISGPDFVIGGGPPSGMPAASSRFRSLSYRRTCPARAVCLRTSSSNSRCSLGVTFNGFVVFIQRRTHHAIRKFPLTHTRSTRSVPTSTIAPARPS